MKKLLLTITMVMLVSLMYSQKLYRAVEKGDAEKVEKLIKKGEDVNEYHKNGLFPLWRASADGNYAICKLLILNGADVMQKSKVEPGNPSAIVLPCQNGDLRMVKLLIENGFEIEHREYLGFTPLRIAAFNGHFDIVRYLVEQGAEIDSKADDKATPLSHAAAKGHVDIVDFLIDEGADVNIKDRDGDFPLGLAAEEGHVEIVKLLLKNGADVKMKNAENKTALQIARENGHSKVAELITDNSQ